MQVILLENIKNMGNIGDVIEVKSGFARNFLISNRGNKNMYLSQNKVAKKMTEEVLLELNNYLK